MVEYQHVGQYQEGERDRSRTLHDAPLRVWGKSHPAVRAYPRSKQTSCDPCAVATSVEPLVTDMLVETMCQRRRESAKVVHAIGRASREM